VVCGVCGRADRWLKTCRTEDGKRVPLCEPCWEELRLVIVAGDTVVTARCDVCGCYANPREFTEVHPGGRKDAYGGVCSSCSEGRS
jgi:hypothetical protein